MQDSERARYFDRQGKPMGLMEWAEAFKDNRVALDEIDGVRISTVWLGLNHRFGPGAPLIFESMVFGGSMDEEQRRYSTEAEAIAGHAALVAEVKAAMAKESADV